MPEGLRMKEDLERAKKSRDDKQKGQQGACLLSRRSADQLTPSPFAVFLQKYHHKGAFYTVCRTSLSFSSIY